MGTGEKLRWGSETPNITRPRGFFAYPSSPPSIPPTIAAAVEAINGTQTVVLKSWEELSISGLYIIDEICGAIDEAEFFCADVTGINTNVLFELGYAIATDKRVWLIRVIEHLLKLSFLGIETSPDVFVFSEELRELKRNKVLGERFLLQSGHERRYEIGRPFRAYLEIH